MLLFELFFLACIIVLALKDGDSYKLKDPSPENISETLKIIKRWHFEGVILNLLFLLPFLYFNKLQWIKILSYSFLIRLSFFDLTFNLSSKLPVKYLGGTSIVDKLFTKIFGTSGAVKKSAFFLLILIALNIFLK